MKKFLASLLLLSGLAFGQGPMFPGPGISRGGAGGPTPGWTSLGVETQLQVTSGTFADTTTTRTVADNYNGDGFIFAFRGKNIITAWNSGAYDSTNNRFCYFGGGHTDGYDNSIFCIDGLSTTPYSRRIQNPTTPTNYISGTWCNGAPPTGTDSEYLPYTSGACGSNNLTYGTSAWNPTHTYAYVFYRSVDNTFRVLGGAVSGTGNPIRAEFKAAVSATPGSNGGGTVAWTRTTTTCAGGTCPDAGGMTANFGWPGKYDSTTDKYWLRISADLYELDLPTLVWTKRSTVAGSINADKTMVIDTAQHYAVVFGRDGVFVGHNLASGYNEEALTCSDSNAGADCTTIGGQRDLGAEYETSDGAFYIWPNCGNSVYKATINTSTKVLTVVKQTYTGGPSDSTHAGGFTCGTGTTNGTFGRWARIGTKKFIVVNDYNLPAFTYQAP